MGTTSHLTPGDFSKSFSAFLRRVIEAQGGRPTERWAEANMPASRGRTYWGKLLNGTQAMTTEDISVLAQWLGVKPFEFIRGVRENDLSLVGVGGSGDDEPQVLSAEEEQRLRKNALDLAAKEDDQK